MDLTRVIAEEHTVGVDEAGFETAMAEQRARSEWKGTGDEAVGEIHRQIANELGEVRFLGYEATVAKAPVRALVVNGQRADRARKGDRVEVVTAETPFYGESGGQVGDTGVIAGAQRAGERPRRAAAGAGPGGPPGRGGRRGDRARRGGRAPGRRGAARPDPGQPLGHPPAPPGAPRAAGRAREAGRIGGGSRPPALRLLPLPAALRRGDPRRGAAGERSRPSERAGRHLGGRRSTRPARPGP